MNQRLNPEKGRKLYKGHSLNEHFMHADDFWRQHNAHSAQQQAGLLHRHTQLARIVPTRSQNLMHIRGLGLQQIELTKLDSSRCPVTFCAPLQAVASLQSRVLVVTIRGHHDVPEERVTICSSVPQRCLV